MKRVLFLCDRALGSKCLQFLWSLDCQIAGVVSRDDKDLNWWGTSRVRRFCEEKRIASYTFSTPLIQVVEESRPDLLISVLYPKVVEKKILHRIPCFNLHCAPLPGYRGFNSTLWAILNDEEMFGATLHEMSEGPDEGNLVAKGSFQMPLRVTNIELYKMAHENGYRLFCENVHALISGQVRSIPQVGSGRYYKKHELPSREVHLSWEDERISTYARAFYFPPFEPAYLAIGEQRVRLIPETRYYSENTLSGDEMIFDERGCDPF